MSTTPRPPLLSDDALLELTYVKEDGRRPSEQVRDYYEAARAKDAELIQRLVNGLHHAQKFAATYGYGPLETINWDLEVASAAGFKPS